MRRPVTARVAFILLPVLVAGACADDPRPESQVERVTSTTDPGLTTAETPDGGSSAPTELTTTTSETSASTSEAVEAFASPEEYTAALLAAVNSGDLARADELADAKATDQLLQILQYRGGPLELWEEDTCIDPTGIHNPRPPAEATLLCTGESVEGISFDVHLVEDPDLGWHAINVGEPHPG